MKKNIIFMIALLIWPYSVLCAEPVSELEATPSVLTNDGAILLITEVNFKNSQADWVELYFESPAGGSINLKGISFADDSVFKKLDNFTVHSGEYFLLTFKSDQTDSPPNLYTPRTGLTGTTEQYIVYDTDGKILDAVCWTSSAPTAAETTDMAELYDKGGWQSASPSSCLNSEEIKNDQSIIRNGFTDTDSGDDWIIAPQPTPAAANIFEETENSDAAVQNTQPSTEEDATAATATKSATITTPAATTAKSTVDKKAPTNTVGEKATSTKKTTTPTTAAKKPTTAKKTSTKATSAKTTTSKKTAAKKYKNGDPSETLTVSEIMPNPVGVDSQNEWIELYNDGPSDINLGNWSLDDEEGGSKPYIIPDTTVIKTKSALIIHISESKISLGNTKDQVRLFDFEGAVKSDVPYEEAPEGQSFALINILGENGETRQEWLWQKEPTPDKANPQYEEFTAQITNPPQKENPYSFQINDSQNRTLTISYSEETLPAPLAIASLTKDTKIKITVAQNETNYELVKYEIIEPAATQQANDIILPSAIGSFITAGGSVFYFLRKRIKIPFLFNRPVK
jgi:hypothetical protein